MSQRRKWICPQCGVGVLGSERPRRDDIVRWCLDCSARTGRLVERTCPTLDRKRTEQRERATQRSAHKAKAERAKARLERERVEQQRARATERNQAQALAFRSIGGVDLLDEADRLWNLPYVRSLSRWGARTPHVEIRRSPHKRHTSGHCWGGGSRARIVITVGTDPHDALGTLLHELIHAALPSGVHHNDLYWMVLRSAARAAWPDAPFRFNEPATTGYARQQQITKGLRAR